MQVVQMVTAPDGNIYWLIDKRKKSPELKNLDCLNGANYSRRPIKTL